MNKAWIKHEHTSAICAIDEDIFKADRQEPYKNYKLLVYLSSGEIMTFNFKTEEEQCVAYETYKPK